MKRGATLSMIVKNEAEKLRRCLASVEDVVEHILIVDTGSTDGAQDVAREFGADVHEIEWPNAFDAARNFGFERVKTEWTFWLDTDEWLLPESVPIFKDAVRSPVHKAYYCLRHDYTEDGRFNDVLLLRLWRTSPVMRVRGIVHENFPESAIEKIRQSNLIAESNIRIGHDGYVGGLAKSKLDRNIALLRQQALEDPNNDYVEFQLIQHALRAGDSDAVELCRAAVTRIMASPANYRTKPLAAVVAANSLLTYSPDEVQSEEVGKIIDFIFSEYKFTPMAIWNVAKVQFLRGEFRRAWESLKWIESMGKTGKFERYNSYNPEIFGSALASNLAMVEERLRARQ